MPGLLILALLFGAMWWFTIRPQQQRLRAQRELIAALTVGDVVLTAGGVIGRIVSMDDEEVVLDAGRGTPLELRVVRPAVTRRIVPAETPES
jgi:preprotein translocase subunit YajC